MKGSQGGSMGKLFLSICAVLLAVLLILSCGDNGTGSQDNYEIIWERSVLNQYPVYMSKMVMCSDGDILIGGNYENDQTNSWDFVMIKVDTAADTVWVLESPSPAELSTGWPRDIEEKASGSFLVAGYGTSSGDENDIFVMDVSATGTVVWDTVLNYLGFDQCSRVTETADGGFVICGFTADNDPLYLQAYAAKFNAPHNFAWQKPMIDSFDTRLSGIAQTADGGFLMAGQIEHAIGSESNIFVIGADNSGDTLWTMELGGDGNDFTTDLLTIGGYHYIGGWTGSIADKGYDLYLAQVDDTGYVYWEENYGSYDGEAPQALNSTDDGNILAVGTRSTGAYPEPTIFLYKISTSGTLLWEAYISTDFARVISAIEGPDQTYYVLIEREVANYDNEAVLMKIRVD